jgi:hypothetical protein
MIGLTRRLVQSYGKLENVDDFSDRFLERENSYD